MKKIFVSICSGLIVIIALAGCSTNIGTKKTQKILTNDVKAELEKAADAGFELGDTPGMMAIVSAEGEKNYIIKRGVSNITTNAPMDENQHYRIASNTKTFVGTAVLMLVDEGKIDLDKSIASYLPDANIPNGTKITVRMLGNMTSGLYDYTKDTSFWQTYAENGHLTTYTPDELLKVAFSHPADFAPGEKYEYCNTNFIVLGLLIEKVTGEPVQDVVTEKIIKPLGLNDTYWPNSIYLNAPYAHGYSIESNSLQDATNWNPSCSYAAGQLVSTINDMTTWAKAFGEGTLLSDKTKAERDKIPAKSDYGFGMMQASGGWIGHAGVIAGYNSHFFYNTAKKISLVIMTNTETNTPADHFTGPLAKILSQ